jgi:ABC-type multidrug transport system ATPase subunit
MTSLLINGQREATIGAPCTGERVGPLAIRVRGLVKRYKDGAEANRGIDLDVQRGELISILGPNGAGKTTFLRQITTELRPSAGTIQIFDEDAIRAPDRAKRMMGISPQEAGLFESLTVREHFELFSRLKGLSKTEARDATREVVQSLALLAESEKRVGSLSGGQRRRILIGLALLGKPPLLILDEPTTGLDPFSRQAVWGVIRRVVTDGAAAVLSTHYIEEAEHLSDRIAIIAQGRLIALGTLDELLARLDRSYRLTWREQLDPFAIPRVHYFASFAEAQHFVRREQPSEYSIARATLEDVYFALTGECFSKEK